MHFDSSAIMPRYARLEARGSSHAYNCANTLLCPFPALCCSKPKNQRLLGLGTHFKKRCQQRLIGAFRWISAQDTPDMHHPSDARQSLACTPVLQLSELICKLIRNLYIIWTVLFGLYYSFIQDCIFIWTLRVRAQL